MEKLINTNKQEKMYLKEMFRMGDFVVFVLWILGEKFLTSMKSQKHIVAKELNLNNNQIFHSLSDCSKGKFETKVTSFNYF